MNEEMNDQYVSALRIDGKLAKSREKYFAEQKSSQQQYLECLLEEDNFSFIDVADVACGGGGLSYWLNKKYSHCHYTLIDLNPDLLSDASNLNIGNNFHFIKNNIYDISEVQDNTFNLTCCWQTLSWLENPEKALHELIRITKQGGRIYLSSLFNDFHEVDIYSKVLDWTRDSTQQGHYAVYNTYSMRTLRTWIGSKTHSVELYKFNIDIDLSEKVKGLGTYTVKSADGKRMQISAGMLLNWGILKIIK